MNIISYTELVITEGGKQVQKGMNFAIQKGYSIVLMSTEKNAPSPLDYFLLNYRMGVALTTKR